MNINNVDDYILVLTEEPDLIDNLPDEVLDSLINYVQKEIRQKEEILNNIVKEINE